MSNEEFLIQIIMPDLSDINAILKTIDFWKQRFHKSLNGGWVYYDIYKNKFMVRENEKWREVRLCPEVKFQFAQMNNIYQLYKAGITRQVH